MTSRQPLVSVVTPVRNEAAALRDCIESIHRQRCDGFNLEHIVIDGRSTDGSREILADLARQHTRLRILDNPRKLTPYGRNIGLNAAAGEYVAMLDAHVVYEPDYIAVCLEELKRHGATGCGGRVIVEPANASTQAQLVAWTVAAPFVSSRKSMRTLDEGYVSTLPYPVFERQALVDVGGYDERLARNQDNDLTWRLISAGHRLYLTARTMSHYRPRPTFTSLVRYAFRAGYWNGVTVRTNPRAMSGRHLIPGTFVAGVLVPPLLAATVRLRGRRAGLAPWWMISPVMLGLHLTGGLATGAQIYFKTRRRAAALLPVYALAFHLAYGGGVLVGLPGPIARDGSQVGGPP